MNENEPVKKLVSNLVKEINSYEMNYGALDLNAEAYLDTAKKDWEVIRKSQIAHPTYIDPAVLIAIIARRPSWYYSCGDLFCTSEIESAVANVVGLITSHQAKTRLERASSLPSILVNEINKQHMQF